jgi:hypothetical protein
MRTIPRTAALAATLALAGALHAQAPLPATPDAKAHPQLAQLKTWLEARSPEARQCALRGGLFLEADRQYRETKSEARAVEAIVQSGGSRLNAAERERMHTIATQVVSLAAALTAFDTDTAGVAFAQMCMSRAQKPGVEPPPAMVRAQLEGALDCQRKHAAGSLDRKECVAAMFRLP